MAEFFHLDSLNDAVNRALDKYTRTVAISLCTSDSSADSDVESITEALRHLYKKSRAPGCRISESLISLAVASIHIFYEDGAFRKLLADVPDFATDWAIHLTTGLVAYGKPTLPVEAQELTCSDCGVSIESNNPLHDQMAWVRWGQPRVVCAGCFPTPHLSGWMSVEYGHGFELAHR